MIMKASLRIFAFHSLLSAWACVYWTSDAMANDEPPLPTWEADLPSDNAMPPGSNFSNLLPEGTEPEAGNEFFLGPSGALKSPPLLLDDSGLSPHDLSLFLHGGLLNMLSEPPEAKPTPSLALREAPALVLDSLKNGPRNEYLMDPQSLLTEIPTLDLERLLQFHASEARILLYILILDRDQKISATAKLNELVARLKADREVCLAVYSLGEPWRTRFLVTEGVNQNSSLHSLTEMAEDCIKDALLTNDAERQLQRFAVKLSTRLFWLEKGLPEAIPITKGVQVLHEVARKPTIENIPHAKTEWPLSQMATVGGIGLLLSAGLRSCWRSWKRSRALKQKQFVWILPETEIRPRLGGAFSGGAGVMIQYGDKIHPTGK